MNEQHRIFADNNTNSISNHFKTPYLFTSQNVSNIITTSNITELISANNPKFHELLYSKELLYPNNESSNHLNKPNEVLINTSTLKNGDDGHININKINNKKSLKDINIINTTTNFNNKKDKTIHTGISNNNNSNYNHNLKINNNAIENKLINSIPTIPIINTSNNNYHNSDINNNHIIKRKVSDDFNLFNSKKQYINNQYEQSNNIIITSKIKNKDLIAEDNQDNENGNII